MRPIYVGNFSQTSAAAAINTVVPMDVQIAPFNTSYAITNVSGNIRGTVAVTLDNIWAAGWDQSAATWFGQTSATGISAATFASLVGTPVTAIRFTMASGIYSGGATFVVVQAGAGGT